jgi:hypothetical protein
MAGGLAAMFKALTGNWRVSGDANGMVRYEPQEGGRFLMQHVDIAHGGRKIRGIEVIGHLKGLDGVESKDVHSRFFSFLDGMTLDYVYEVEGDILTIWGGEKGSPAFYRGKFSDDGGVLTGGWRWPGGGYATISQRID